MLLRARSDEHTLHIMIHRSNWDSQSGGFSQEHVVIHHPALLYLYPVKGWHCSCRSPCPQIQWRVAWGASSQLSGCVRSWWGAAGSGSTGWRSGSVPRQAQLWQCVWQWDLVRREQARLLVDSVISLVLWHNINSIIMFCFMLTNVLDLNFDTFIDLKWLSWSNSFKSKMFYSE